jgi:mono/diheme cytochrome c family protein
MPKRPLFAMLAFLAVTASSGRAQQMPNPLPDNVRQWLESDQLQRWARLIQVGDSLFNHGSCTRCHREGAIGGERAPNLTDNQWDHGDGSLEAIRETIFWGVRRRDFKDPKRPFEMNPSGGMSLSWDEVRAVAAYVWSLSNGNFLPQRR